MAAEGKEGAAACTHVAEAVTAGLKFLFNQLRTLQVGMHAQRVVVSCRTQIPPPLISIAHWTPRIRTNLGLV